MLNQDVLSIDEIKNRQIRAATLASMPTSAVRLVDETLPTVDADKELVNRQLPLGQHHAFEG